MAPAYLKMENSIFGMTPQLRFLFPSNGAECNPSNIIDMVRIQSQKQLRTRKTDLSLIHRVDPCRQKEAVPQEYITCDMDLEEGGQGKQTCLKHCCHTAVSSVWTLSNLISRARKSPANRNNCSGLAIPTKIPGQEPYEIYHWGSVESRYFKRTEV